MVKGSDTSLIVSTYNRPGALALVLESVKRQSVLPREVIVADDGSSDETAALIGEMAESFPVRLVHAWQPDEGFRLARVQNLGASRASGSYLVFLDGDLILHPRFIESHIRFAGNGRLLSGGRAMLSPDFTRKLITEQALPTCRQVLLNSHNKHNIFHSNLLARIFTSVSQTDSNMKGGNSSLFYSDFARLNGRNEDFQAWGFEDSEFAIRAMRAGMRKYKLRFCAVTFHLDHGKDNLLQSGTKTDRNLDLLQQARQSDMVACENGLSNHLVP